MLLFAAAQAALFLASGESWTHSSAWWPLTGTAANVASFVLLKRAAGRVGPIYRPPGTRVRDGWKALLLFFVLAGPVGMLPGFAVSWVLYGDPAAAGAAMVQPLPWAAAIAGAVLFPLSIGLTELPLYFGWLRPRLEARWGPGSALAATAGFLAAQHAALPLLFDARFIAWRVLAFLPLAVLIGALLRRRPGLMPALMVVHALSDLGVALSVLQASLPR